MLLYGFVSAGHRLADRASLSAGDFVPDEVIPLDSGHCLHGQVSRVCLGTLETHDERAVRLRFVGGSLEGVIRIVESGQGVTLLPELAATTLPESSRRFVRPLQPPVPARQVSMITHGEGIRTRLLEVLRQSIFNGIPQGLKKKRRTGGLSMLNRPENGEPYSIKRLPACKKATPTIR